MLLHQSLLLSTHKAQHLIWRLSSVAAGPNTPASEWECPATAPSSSPGPPPTQTHTQPLLTDINTIPVYLSVLFILVLSSYLVAVHFIISTLKILKQRSTYFWHSLFWLILRQYHLLVRFTPHPMWVTAFGRTDLLDLDISNGYRENGEGNEGHGAWVWNWTHLHLNATGLTLRK